VPTTFPTSTPPKSPPPSPSTPRPGPRPLSPTPAAPEGTVPPRAAPADSKYCPYTAQRRCKKDRGVGGAVATRCAAPVWCACGRRVHGVENECSGGVWLGKGRVQGPKNMLRYCGPTDAVHAQFLCRAYGEQVRP